MARKSKVYPYAKAARVDVVNTQTGATCSLIDDGADEKTGAPGQLRGHILNKLNYIGHDGSTMYVLANDADRVNFRQASTLSMREAAGPNAGRPFRDIVVDAARENKITVDLPAELESRVAGKAAKQKSKADNDAAQAAVEVRHGV